MSIPNLTRSAALKLPRTTYLKLVEALNETNVKADKVTGGTENSVALIDSDGNLISGEKSLPSGLLVGDSDDQILTEKLVKVSILEHDDDTEYTLTTNDLNKSHVFTMTEETHVYLPVGDLSYLYNEIVCIKNGVGVLMVHAFSNNYILDSSIGGSIDCSDDTREFSKIGLRLMTATKWHTSPDCFGIWNTR